MAVTTSSSTSSPRSSTTGSPPGSPRWWRAGQSTRASWNERSVGPVSGSCRAPASTTQTGTDHPVVSHDVRRLRRPGGRADPRHRRRATPWCRRGLARLVALQEAAVNEAYAEFPIWGMCPYDTRITPPAVLADVAATHPHLADAHGGHRRNDDHRDATAGATHPSRVEPLTARAPSDRPHRPDTTRGQAHADIDRGHGGARTGRDE